ncbi:hypothetical protein HDV05_005406, partial [Chytridiales sp. JEL 0842]
SQITDLNEKLALLRDLATASPEDSGTGGAIGLDTEWNTKFSDKAIDDDPALLQFSAGKRTLLIRLIVDKPKGAKEKPSHMPICLLNFLKDRSLSFVGNRVKGMNVNESIRAKIASAASLFVRRRFHEAYSLCRAAVDDIHQLHGCDQEGHAAAAVERAVVDAANLLLLRISVEVGKREAVWHDVVRRCETPMDLTPQLLIAGIKAMAMENKFREARALFENWMTSQPDDHLERMTQDRDQLEQLVLLIHVYVFDILTRLEDWTFAMEFLTYNTFLSEDNRSTMITQLSTLHQQHQQSKDLKAKEEVKPIKAAAKPDSLPSNPSTTQSEIPAKDTPRTAAPTETNTKKKQETPESRPPPQQSSGPVIPILTQEVTAPRINNNARWMSAIIPKSSSAVVLLSIALASILLIKNGSLPGVGISRSKSKEPTMWQWVFAKTLATLKMGMNYQTV